MERKEIPTDNVEIGTSYLAHFEDPVASMTTKMVPFRDMYMFVVVYLFDASSSGMRIIANFRN